MHDHIFIYYLTSQGIEAGEISPVFFFPPVSVKGAITAAAIMRASDMKRKPDQLFPEMSISFPATIGPIKPPTLPTIKMIPTAVAANA